MDTLRNALITASAAMALVLAGCGGDSSVSSDELDGEPGINQQNAAAWNFEPGTHPEFDPAGSNLPLNTDLIFSGSNDGTANVGVPENAAEDAINDLDGFSTSAYFDVAFAGGEIDPGSVCAALAPCGSVPPNVFVLKLSTSGDALPISSIAGVDSAVNVSAEVVDQDGGTDNVLRIFPEQTLDAKSKYLVFVTDTIQDKSGDAITPSFHYNLLRDPEPEVSSGLQSVRQAIRQAWEPSANGFLTSQGIPGNVAISYSYTTTDPLAPLVAMGAPRASLYDEGSGAPESLIDSLDLSTPEPRSAVVSAATKLDLNTVSDGALNADVADMYTGYIELPQYLPVPPDQSATSFAYLQQFWRPNESIATALGQPVPEDTDGSKNVTYRYPYAEEKVSENYPLQVTLPDKSYTSAARGGVTCEDYQQGTNNTGTGYPVVMYIHGITSDRTSVTALAHSLAKACVATVAVDLPLHGVPAGISLNMDNGSFASAYGSNQPRERHFEVIQNEQGNPAPMDSNATSGSGDWFINLGSLQNTRDNLRQAVLDQLNLNASLGNISALDLDSDSATTNDLNLNQVSVVGVSLGGIVGTVYSTVNQVAKGQVATANANGATFTDNLNPIQGMVASAAGSQLTQVLVNSDTFAPRINAGLQANGVAPGTSNYERFLYVAQSTVASGDPVNFAGTFSTLGVPAVVQQIVGGGDASPLGDSKTYVSDKVVPNTATVTGAPLAGTTPLASLLGASQVDETDSTYDVSTGNGLVNLTVGHHASLLRPNEESGETPTAGEFVATSELQRQVVSFVASQTTAMAIGDEPQGHGSIPDGYSSNFVEDK